jgi:CRISPR-associated protein Cmr4
MIAQLTFVHALSPLHAGTGQGAGVIDLPTAREKATGLPFLPGSSLKGALRTRCSILNHNNNSNKCQLLFGTSDPADDNSQAGLVQISDQRLLLLPVRSLAGTFAWVTSPYVLRRLQRDITDAAIASSPDTLVPDVNAIETCYLATSAQDSKIVFKGLHHPSKVYLEDLDLHISEDNPSGATAWARRIARQVFPADTDAEWRHMLLERFCLIHDDVFNFLMTTATEITARIKLKEDAKAVIRGGLWYEETLPTETILSGIALIPPSKERKLDVFAELKTLMGQPLQLGGKATVGRGLCHVQISGGEQ